MPTIITAASAPSRIRNALDALRVFAARSPLAAAAVLLAVGTVGGAGAREAIGGLQAQQLQTQVQKQQAEIALTRRGAQREINAMAARLGELQAQANRLNALGDRLTRIGQLDAGEFDFGQPVGIGGAGPVQDMAPSQLLSGLDQIDRQFASSGRQLSVLEALLFNRALDRQAMPTGAPVADSYITSGFGGRADPINGGAQFHKGIDFEANTGDPVLAVGDGVVSYAGVRSGYGMVVEVDHGNGYVTRYAHNSRLVKRVGDLVRAGGEIAKAGSTGRSTGAHVHFEVWENGHVVDPRKFLGQRQQAWAG